MPYTHCFANLLFPFEEFVQLEPLLNSLCIDHCLTIFVPVVVAVAFLFENSTILVLSGERILVGPQWAATHLVVGHLRFLGVFRTQHSKSK